MSELFRERDKADIISTQFCAWACLPFALKTNPSVSPLPERREQMGRVKKKKKKKSRLREKELHHLRECVRRAIGVTRHLSRHVSRDAGVSIQRFGRRGDSGDDKVAVKASP